MNIERDSKVKKELEEVGVKILIVWECTVNRMMKDETTAAEVVGEIERFLRSDDAYCEK